MKEKKYYSLYRELKEKILCGEYSSASKLPSKRIMADKTGYSVITVEKAYAMLEDEGYIYARERSGYYVCKIDSTYPLIPSKDKEIYARLPELTSPAATPDFEASLWLKTIRKVISEREHELFIKAPNKGCHILRNAISDYLRRYRGMLANPANIIVGSGSEQLYEAVVKMLGREKTYGIESPSYAQIEAVYTQAGASICKLKMGSDGIDSAELREKSFDVLHVTPFHSFPSGITTSVSKKYEYLHWAQSEDGYIVEDDFDSEFFVPGHPIETLYSLDKHSSVIYINTFSKSLSPSMRMGYMILPDELIERYDQNLGIFSCSVPVLEQYVLAEFILSGNFERHLNRIRRKLKAERNMSEN